MNILWLPRTQCVAWDMFGALCLVADDVWFNFPGNIINLADVQANAMVTPQVFGLDPRQRITVLLPLIPTIRVSRAVEDEAGCIAPENGEAWACDNNYGRCSRRNGNNARTHNLVCEYVDKAKSMSGKPCKVSKNNSKYQ